MRRLASTLLLATMLSGFSAPASAHGPIPDTLVETVRLGHDPVQVSAESRARLTFHGEKGQLVNLARWSVSGIAVSTPRGRRTLRLGGKAVTAFADGYWRLPADGTYSATWRPAEDAVSFGRVGLQVRKVVRKDVALDDPTATFPSSSNKTYVARVRLTDERIRLRSTGDLDHVMRGTGLTIEPIGGTELFLEPGVTIHSEDFRSWLHGQKATSGTYLVAVAAGSRVTVSTPQTTPLVLDGPTSGPRSSAFHEQLFTFEGVAGQVVFRTSSDSNWYDDELTGPDGTQVSRLGLVAGWELPTTGTYTLSARALDDAGLPTDFTLRLRTATSGPAMAVGEPAHFVPTEAGRWVVSRIQMPAPDPYGRRLDATNLPTTDTTWSAAATVAALVCPFESTANGCGSQVGARVDSAGPSGRFDGQPNAGSTMLVIYDPGGSTAPVDLAIRSGS